MLDINTGQFFCKWWNDLKIGWKYVLHYVYRDENIPVFDGISAISSEIFYLVIFKIMRLVLIIFVKGYSLYGWYFYIIK